MSGLLPLFPLQLTASPGGLVSLHIFEPRYKEMVGEAAASGTEFGIVLAFQNGISSTGCTVVVEEVANLQPDGSFDITARGKRRFKIISLNQEKAYLQAEVQYLEESSGPLSLPRNGFGHKPPGLP